MKREKLTCEKARNISIVPTLGKLGHFPIRENEKEAWLLSPFREETQASFKVSKRLNRWYDHGEGFGGNVIDLIIKLKGCNTKEALSFLNDESSFSFQKQPSLQESIPTSPEYEILKVKKLKNQALLGYLNHRCIDVEIAQQYCKEIYYRSKSKRYFAISFQNDSNGYELRNKYFKGCIGSKEITSIKNNHSKLVVFEGFLDFLSYKTLFKSESLNEDYIISNSVGMIKNISPFITDYRNIYAYLDNDEPGQKAIAFLKQNHKAILDCSFFYHKHNDLNDYLVMRRSQKESKSDRGLHPLSDLPCGAKRR
ncbi:toprim domain-containing protein [Aquimarina sediminis]|uniref:toprim domain-containing protein n=1 Tax=Aquimarina sediminis TaxID=2070536 RepID=UPI0013E8C1DD|nr:toprim domain-containing protein [Aquimarina sediminis]